MEIRVQSVAVALLVPHLVPQSCQTASVLILLIWGHFRYLMVGPCWFWDMAEKMFMFETKLLFLLSINP